MTKDKIQAMRKRLGLTQMQLAAKLGVSFVTVNRWERGHVTPQPDRLQRLQELNLMPDPEFSDQELAQAIREVSMMADFGAYAIKLQLAADRLQNLHRFQEGIIKNAPECGACAETLFCGSTMNSHSKECQKPDEASVAEVK